jgi:Domain of unknown function (DUF5658)
MTYGIAQTISAARSLRVGATWRLTPRCWCASYVSWLLLVLFAGLQIADVVTTNRALAMPGVWEANPLMALLQTQLGVVWWLPKVAVVAFVCFATPVAQRPWPMIFAVSYYTVIVSINLTHL